MPTFIVGDISSSWFLIPPESLANGALDGTGGKPMDPEVPVRRKGWAREGGPDSPVRKGTEIVSGGGAAT